MKTWLAGILRFLAVILVFGVGMASGFYYHTEIGVVWDHLWPDKSVDSMAVPTNLPPVDETQQTVLELPNLPEKVPLVFSETLDEAKLQDYLKQGAVVLPLGKTFGETGNVVITAHSSGTTGFGPYRFAFAKLAELKTGEEFKVSTPKATYTYRVYGQEIVWPTEVDKLPNDNRSTVTLVTCWPLWTNFKRLLVNSELVGVDYKI